MYKFLVLGLIAAFAACSQDEFYALNLSYAQGGHLGKAEVIITINGERPDFFGQDHSNVSEFSGTDMSYINDFIKEGENTISLEIIPSDNVSEEKKSERSVFHISIDYLKKGEMMDTGAKGNLFNYSVEVQPGEAAPKWEKTFVIKKANK